jgi:hypothetical protein
MDIRKQRPLGFMGPLFFEFLPIHGASAGTYAREHAFVFCEANKRGTHVGEAWQPRFVAATNLTAIFYWSDHDSTYPKGVIPLFRDTTVEFLPRYEGQKNVVIVRPIPSDPSHRVVHLSFATEAQGRLMAQRLAECRADALRVKADMAEIRMDDARKELERSMDAEQSLGGVIDVVQSCIDRAAGASALIQDVEAAMVRAWDSVERADADEAPAAATASEPSSTPMGMSPLHALLAGPSLHGAESASKARTSLSSSSPQVDIHNAAEAARQVFSELEERARHVQKASEELQRRSKHSEDRFRELARVNRMLAKSFRQFVNEWGPQGNVRMFGRAPSSRGGSRHKSKRHSAPRRKSWTADTREWSPLVTDVSELKDPSTRKRSASAAAVSSGFSAPPPPPLATIPSERRPSHISEVESESSHHSSAMYQRFMVTGAPVDVRPTAVPAVERSSLTAKASAAEHPLGGTIEPSGKSTAVPEGHGKPPLAGESAGKSAVPEGVEHGVSRRPSWFGNMVAAASGKASTPPPSTAAIDALPTEIVTSKASRFPGRIVLLLMHVRGVSPSVMAPNTWTYATTKAFGKEFRTPGAQVVVDLENKRLCQVPFRGVRGGLVAHLFNVDRPLGGEDAAIHIDLFAQRTWRADQPIGSCAVATWQLQQWLEKPHALWLELQPPGTAVTPRPFEIPVPIGADASHPDRLALRDLPPAPPSTKPCVLVQMILTMNPPQPGSAFPRVRFFNGIRSREESDVIDEHSAQALPPPPVDTHAHEPAATVALPSPAGDKDRRIHELEEQLRAAVARADDAEKKLHVLARALKKMKTSN